MVSLALTGMLIMLNANISAAESLGQLKQAREAFLFQFRSSGVMDRKEAGNIEQKLVDLQKSASGETRVKVLFELATIQRINNKFAQAIDNYKKAISEAQKIKNTQLEFDAWLGLARATVYGQSDHGKAAAAFRAAVAAAGSDPNPKQQYEIANYSAQLKVYRGELEAALIDSLRAIRLAQSGDQQFYALLDTGDVVQKFAESCDYRKLVDAKTNYESDPWGACKRSVAAAADFYQQARNKAKELGWSHLEKQAQGFIDNLKPRLFLINQKAEFESLSQTGVFTAQDAHDVLVNENFASGGSELGQGVILSALIDEVVPDSQLNDPRSVYLIGIKADLDKQPEKALSYYQRAARLLGEERASLFDLRQRGTVIENRPELIRDLGLRLLDLKHDAEAFLVFESFRSRGMGGLATAFASPGLNATERQTLAELVQLESHAGTKLSRLVENTLAGISLDDSMEYLQQWLDAGEQYQEKRQQSGAVNLIKKLSGVNYSATQLSDLKALVKKTGISVLSYWVTPTNVVVWVISPEASEVKTVFLPEPALAIKVNKLLESVRTRNDAFDRVAAKELYAYLVKPFADVLTQQIMIIPQGLLVNLPFEVLVDARTNKHMVETYTVSYAPNASIAARILSQPYAFNSAMTVLYDEAIDKRTREVSKLETITSLSIDLVPTSRHKGSELIESLSKPGSKHVLLHGKFNHEDALQSTLKLSEQAKQPDYVTAADLLSVNWRNTPVAVLSACEGAKANVRVSNEMFGFSWSLLIGGVDHVVLSRWMVNEISNAQWMEHFYQNLSKSTPAQASAIAMRAMMEKVNKHPYYWAGPQVFGK